jgi:hypothetical protein
MKLPRLRRRLATERTEPSPEPGEQANSSPPVAPAFEVLAYARTGLPEKEFSAQKEALKQILSYDGETRSWYAWLPFDQPERAAEILTASLDAARAHGTTIQVRAHRAAGGNLPGQMP